MARLLALLVFEVIILGGLVGYLQVRYAQANYPKSSRWKWVLFLAGFIAGTTGLATILYQEATSYELLLFSILTGIVSGLFSCFLSPYQMQYIYPKRSERSEYDQD